MGGSHVRADKAIVRRLYDEVFSKGNVDAADELMIEDYAQHTVFGVPSGRAAFKDFIRGFVGAYPDAKVTIHDMIAEGDKVAARVSVRGTNKRELMGIPATDKQVTMTAIDIFRLKDGRIVEHWDEVDRLSFLQQLGAIPPMEAPEEAPTTTTA